MSSGAFVRLDRWLALRGPENGFGLDDRKDPPRPWGRAVWLGVGKDGLAENSPYIDKDVFAELKRPAYFRSARAAFGGIMWPHEQDVSPETAECGLQETL